MPVANHDPSTFCPRCAFDLRTALAQAEGSDRGRCTECGLEIIWAELQREQDQPWLFEYHWRQGVFRRLFLTILKSFRPRAFWQSAKLEDHIRPWPVLIALVLPWCEMLALGMVYAVRAEVIEPRESGMTINEILQAVSTVFIALLRDIGGLVGGPLAWLVGMPIFFLLVHRSLGRVGVRPLHVLRIGLYSLLAPSWLVAVWFTVLLGLVLAGREDIAIWLTPIGFTMNMPIQTQMIVAVIMLLGLTVAVGTWAVIWWTSACRSYLRLDRYIALVGLSATGSFLLALCLFFTMTTGL